MGRGKSKRGSRAITERSRVSSSTFGALQGASKSEELFQQAIDAWFQRDFELTEQLVEKLLDADPSDARGARYVKASILFAVGREPDLAAWLAERNEKTGSWRFAQALAAFRQHGDSDEARRLLEEARKIDTGFIDYLLRDATADASQRIDFTKSLAVSARSYALLFLPVWRATPGAATWARRVLRVPVTRRETSLETPENASIRTFPRTELSRLPQGRDAWHVVIVEGPPSNDGERHWYLAVLSVGTQQIRHMTSLESEPTPDNTWSELLTAFLSPTDGDPGRPREVLVEDRHFANAWLPFLRELDIQCAVTHRSWEVQRLMTGLVSVMTEAFNRATNVDVDEIARLPQRNSVWQADFVLSPHWVSNETEGLYRPWTVQVIEPKKCVSMGVHHIQGDPKPEDLWDILLGAMMKPMMRSPHRPRTVEVCDSGVYEFLKPRLEGVRIACVLRDSLPELSEYSTRLAHVDANGKPPMTHGRDVTHQLMEEYYESAARYFEEAPWERVPAEIPIRVRAKGRLATFGTRYAIVIGRSGIQTGLVLYDDWKTTKKALQGFGDPNEQQALCVLYDEAMVLSSVDLNLIERNNWPIATPEAYPALMKMDPGCRPRAATADEMRLMMAVMRAIPDFLAGMFAPKTYRLDLAGELLDFHLDMEAD